MYQNILQTIGNTPLVQINLPTPARVFGKMEYTNPGGSIKDRPALYMVTQAESQGKIKANGTLVLPSSGNMGIALAMIGNLKNHRVVITLAEKTSAQKINILKAYGAEVILCPSTTDQNDPKGYVQTAARLAKEQNAFLIDQFNDTLNQEAHYHGLGPEIWRDTGGCITHFVAAAGTGGTVSGAGRYLKEKNPAIRVYAADPENSFYSTNGNPKPYQVEAFGIDSVTDVFDEDVVDQVIPLPDKDVIEMTRSLCHDHGHLVGFSAGAAALAVLKLNLSAEDTVVFPLCDSGKPYLEKLFPA